ncbi:hypothetical protein A0127_05880 [Thermococcus peptonophilus]|uniref:Uncharacterized protein n=3 Tax=Thermococcus peptonophilus TaxID=53952 RepID=A0A142CVD0_9EURY|nr:hypothetical protein A0127_05880 [Thermococcus peptonophilus]
MANPKDDKDKVKFKIAKKIIELGEKGEELTVYNLTKRLREISKKEGEPKLDVGPEQVRRVLNELVKLKVLAPFQGILGEKPNGKKPKKPYQLLWPPEKAYGIVECWEESHSLQGFINALSHLEKSTKKKTRFQDLAYTLCPYMVLLGIDWIEGLTGFLGKFDWGTFLDRAIPLYNAVFSLRHDGELKALNENYIGGDFFLASGSNSCRFFEEARWVNYVARRKAKTEIEDKLLEMFYEGNELRCASLHYGNGVSSLSNYIIGIRYALVDSKIVVFDFSPNPFLRREDDGKVTKSFKKLLEYLEQTHKEAGSIQVRTLSPAMEELLKKHFGFEESDKFYLFTRTEKIKDGSRFIVEFSKNPPSVYENEWIIKVLEKKIGFKE